VRLETERLVLREWTDADREIYASFVGDPEVRRFYPTIMTRKESDEAVDRFIGSLRRDGFGLLAVERKSDGALLGDVGLVPVEMPIRGNPPVEIGWLLGRQYWGQGYAPEAALACLTFAFATLAVPEVVAWTTVINLPSQRVMQKIGMVRHPEDDFLHPKVPEGHPLGPHVLYRITRPSPRA
jgi:RimJ/RimL family protein N-acetyltransferase